MMLEDVATYLKSQGLIVGVATDTFLNTMPDQPDACIGLYEEIGAGALPYSVEAAHRTLRIMVRDTKASTTREKAWAIYKSLCVNGYFLQLTPDRYALMYNRGTPYKSRLDAQGRTYYTIDFGITTIND